jgi:hypothetical protein
LFSGLLGATLNLGSWLAVAQSKPTNLDPLADAQFASMPLMSAGAVAAGGFVLLAIADHDARAGAAHAGAHARQRLRAGLGVMIAGALMSAAAIALIPAMVSAPRRADGSASEFQSVAVFAWPTLLTLGNATLSVGIPLFLVGRQDGD